MITYSPSPRERRVTDSDDYKRVLSNGMRVSEPYTVSKQSAYVKRMVDELKAIPREKRPPTTTQEPSTVALLEAQRLRPESEDAAYIALRRNTPIAKEAQVRHADGTVNTGERHLNYQDVLLFEDNRKKARNTMGQSELSSVDAEKKEKAIQAFTYSKPAEPAAEDLKRLKSLTEMDAVMATEVPKPIRSKKPWWRFWDNGPPPGVPMSEWTDAEYKYYWGVDRDPD